MVTNDEIREQENRQMAHYKSLTPDEQAYKGLEYSATSIRYGVRSQ